MAKVYDKLVVDVKVKRDNIVTTVQNDSNSRFLDVYLKDNGLPIDLKGHEVRLYCKKPEGVGEIFNNGEITEPTNGRCQFLLTDQTLAKEGYVEAQITIYYQNTQVLQSMPFRIHVTTSLKSDSAIESSNEYGALVILFQNLYEAHDLMTDMVQNQGEKGAIATDRNVDTFWQMLEYMAKYLDTDLTTLLNQVLQDASVQGVIDRLGETTDTGGTATTGTVMGKLNELVSKNAKVNSRTKVLTTIVGTSITVSAYSQSNPYRVIGSGVATIYSSYGSDVYFSIDGRAWKTLGAFYTGRNFAVELFFEEKIELYAVSNPMFVLIQT